MTESRDVMGTLLTRIRVALLLPQTYSDYRARLGSCECHPLSPGNWVYVEKARSYGFGRREE